ncbi:putative ATP synthase subunit c [Candidatus Mycoplasma haematolamae str. Purdue]|uniref:ATP synthase subunit c n=1 Tax=Mycoplasma haematolamae (strain Purdue) TaxID=1212765 RepID=I7BAC3_MYCHA|nr:ATP synthase F0 subunit C [Candidatus Mycoplasma haematolamae]AFO52245.1 putative ATP synthase subunit c [Candidatus Mycoplasma haematolamae str. Purdue]
MEDWVLGGGGGNFVFQNGKDFQNIGAGIAILAGVGAALAQGYIGGKAVESLARNPEVEALIFRQFIIGAAVCESVAIYGLIIAIVIRFGS